MADKRTCPHCGNTNLEHFEDNGYELDHMDCTLLCLAPVEPGDECNPDAKDGVCGCQFEPNDPDHLADLGLLDEDEDEGLQRASTGRRRALGREWE